ncbi:hypothetical protein [uncultured Lactobacillus sp.]|uniref:hypothetical protein n=1 Tax=uncultured Lactobacillus sp. TaxID=153152 RepID=UPI002622100E|nr:hypothetical protein [uncultured Lactobacillus sp.]
MENWTIEAINMKAEKEFDKKWRDLEDTAEKLGLGQEIVIRITNLDEWKKYRQETVQKFKEEIQERIIDALSRGIY